MKNRPKILIVDDRPENLFSLEKLLLDTQAEIISAGSGNEALTATLNHEFSMAILDVQMPEMDGYELAELLRSEEKTCRLPIIFVSAVYSSDYHVFKGYDSGAVDFLVKPFDTKILLSKVAVFLELFNQKQEIEASEKVLQQQYGELQASELRFETLVNTVPDIVYRIDPDGHFTFINEAITKLGYKPEELIGIHFSTIILPIDLPSISRVEALKARERSIEKSDRPPKLFDERRTGLRKTTGLEIRLISKLNNQEWVGVVENLEDESIIVEVNSSGFYSDQVDRRNKIFLGTVGVIRDVTNRKKLEDNLKKAKDDLESKVADRTAELLAKNSELTIEIDKRKQAEQEASKAKQEWQDIFNAIGHMAMVLDRNHTIVDVNRSTLTTFDCTEESLVGQKCHEIFHHSDSPHRLCPMKQACDAQTSQVSEVLVKSLDKSFIVSCTPIFDQDGQISKIIHIMTDISERKRLEKELIQAHKMEAIGTLAGGIAHDFNNILTSLLGFTQLIMSDVKKDSDIEKDLNEVYSAGLRAKELVRQILTFARKTEEEMMPLRVDLIVKEVLKFMRSTIPTTIKIKDMIDSKSKVMANATQIHQVIMNLCTNAGHAMNNNGGILQVTLEDFELDGTGNTDFYSALPGSYIRLTVSDTGEGIPHDILDRVFEPYFTTKSVDEGTGMGLALVQGIVKEAGGLIHVDSQINQGTTFEILLPTTTQDRSEHRNNTLEPVSGEGNILFVDDERPITKLGKRMLEEFGYRVTIENNPVQALALFGENPEKFDVVISDLTMPDMRGDQFIKAVKDIRKDIPCLLCTGYSKELTKKETQSKEIAAAVLIKPFDRTRLVSAVQQALKSKPI